MYKPLPNHSNIVGQVIEKMWKIGLLCCVNNCFKDFWICIQVLITTKDLLFLPYAMTNILPKRQKQKAEAIKMKLKNIYSLKLSK